MSPVKPNPTMTPRQCEIAAEAYAASLLARAGYDVLVQYGANQPQYDLVAVKGQRMLPVSVKGSQDGGWMLAVRHKDKTVTYHGAIDRWLAVQRDDVVFVFIQFIGVGLGDAPRAYVARPSSVAVHLKEQADGRGYGSLQEDIRRERPGSKYQHRIPEEWMFSQERVDSI
jgi:Holliday junction resolvase-like predicted endonuclease